MTKLNVTQEEQDDEHYDDDTLQAISFARDCIELARKRYKLFQYCHVAIDVSTSSVQDVLDNDADTIIVVAEQETNKTYVSFGNARYF